MRLLWVVPRFGATVVGGAEALVAGLARHATPAGCVSEIATTCALDHTSWQNELPAGSDVDDGLTVHRFAVDQRDRPRHDALHARLLERGLSYADELEWLSHGVCSRTLEEFLEDTVERYALRIFAPYLFGTTLWGALVTPERSAMLPCLHDEPYARLRSVGAAMRAVRGCIFNADAERWLAQRLIGPTAGWTVGMGFEPAAPKGHAADLREEIGPYVVYAGRLEEGKGVHLAVEYATRHRGARADSPTLVLMGSGSYRPPKEAQRVVHVLGYADEDAKRATLRNALALVQPSHLESFSIVLMESWREGTPALVNRRSDVMTDHCIASGGGLAFDSFAHYSSAIDRWLDDGELRSRQGQAGRAYVAREYSWEAVTRRLGDAVEGLTR